MASLMINSAFINNGSHDKTYKPSNLTDGLQQKGQVKALVQNQ